LFESSTQNSSLMSAGGTPVTASSNYEQPPYCRPDKYGAAKKTGQTFLGFGPVLVNAGMTQSASCHLVIAQCDERYEYDTEKQYQHAEQ